MAFAAATPDKAQTSGNEWTWMGGSNVNGQPGVYGMLGTAAAGNIPGSRAFQSSWTDGEGNLWMFGGYPDLTGTLFNDLWEFNISTNEWAWISGSSTPNEAGVYGTLGTPGVANVPGARSEGTSWTDRNGHLWLLGGSGIDAAGIRGALNDLWEFDPSTQEWSWISGSSTLSYIGGNPPQGWYAQPGVYGTLGTAVAGNVPGSRSGASAWVDSSGNFWLFGGNGFDANGIPGWLNDLWMFAPATDEWTWEGGSSSLPNPTTNTGGWPGVYGTLGTPSVSNIPGGRLIANSWTDGSGNFWLFGGLGLDSESQFSDLNDLWRFQSSTKEWTWMSGGTISNCTLNADGPCGLPGVYGSLGIPARTNVPGARTSSANWTDSSGSPWIFGGAGFDSAGTLGVLNDLWKFDTRTNEWTWMGGGNVIPRTEYGTGGLPGVYGILGTPAAGDIPGTRWAVAQWTDRGGDFWIFGGQGYDSEDNDGYLNDLWEYQPPTPAAPAFSSAASATFTSGTAESFTLATTAYPVAMLIETGTLPGGVTFTNNGDGTATLAGTPTANGIFHITITANNGVSPNATQSFTLTVNPPGAVMTSPKPGSTVTGPSVTFTWTAVSGVTAYQLWLGTSGPGSSSLFNSGSTTATSVTATDIPAYGATIYARLYSEIGGKWQWVDYTYTESGTPAVLLSPKAGSTFSSTSQTFTWTAGAGVTNYQLWMGTSGAGSSSMYNSGSITATSTTVPSIPAYGQTVYVRLYSEIAGGWQYHDYTFTEEGAPAVLTAPRVGSTLAASDVTFTWNTGEGVTDYQLWLGTSGAGSSNLYNSGAVTTTSVTIPTLQANGVPLYARLYSETGGVWSYYDYTFVEAGTPGAMVSPAQGSTLGSSSVTFTWTTGKGNTNYQLWLGLSGVGSSNLYNSGSITTTSTTVPSLPAKGATVYARLYSESGGVWSYHDYTYIEQ